MNKLSNAVSIRSIIILLFLFFTHCSNNPYYATPEEVVQKNIDFMNDENIEGTLSTIFPGSDSYDATENLVKKLFKVYDLNYKLEKIEVVEENDKKAVVNFTQLTTKVSGPNFKNNRVMGTHILKKDGDSWKIFSTKILDTKFIN